MTAPQGLVVMLSALADEAPVWWKVVDGHIVSRSAGAALAGMTGPGAAGDAGKMPVMLVVPQNAVTMRRVDLPQDMPAAQARTVALRMAREASIGETDGLHGVTMTDDPQSVAVIARDDMAHFIAWARHQGLEPGIILPAGAILPEPESGFVAARIAGSQVVRGRGLVASMDEGWVRGLIGDAPVRMLGDAELEAAIIAALAGSPVNLRTGEFGPPRESLLTPDMLKRWAIWIGFIALATLLISLVLIAKYHWSASRLDARTVETARSVLPAANDAKLAAEEIDRMLARKGGGGQGFTGPVAGLMTVMQSVPGVSLTALSLGDDGLVHATLASARADDINTVLLGVQAAGFRITATSSADPGGRVIAEVTVRS